VAAHRFGTQYQTETARIDTSIATRAAV